MLTPVFTLSDGHSGSTGQGIVIFETTFKRLSSLMSIEREPLFATTLANVYQRLTYAYAFVYAPVGLLQHRQPTRGLEPSSPLCPM